VAEKAAGKRISPERFLLILKSRVGKNAGTRPSASPMSAKKISREKLQKT
jgi:hypothetical protein